MREILFRGKRVDNGDWVYGGILQNLRKNKWHIGDMFEAVEVAKETVGQYTGLKDKHDVKIFEGDIVLKRTYNGKKPFPVKFDGGMFYAGIGGGSSTATHRYTLEDKQIEVIGNIYDNNDLLKDKEDEK